MKMLLNKSINPNISSRKGIILQGCQLSTNTQPERSFSTPSTRDWAAQFIIKLKSVSIWLRRQIRKQFHLNFCRAEIIYIKGCMVFPRNPRKISKTKKRNTRMASITENFYRIAFRNLLKISSTAIRQKLSYLTFTRWTNKWTLVLKGRLRPHPVANLNLKKCSTWCLTKFERITAAQTSPSRASTHPRLKCMAVAETQTWPPKD